MRTQHDTATFLHSLDHLKISDISLEANVSTGAGPGASPNRMSLYLLAAIARRSLPSEGSWLPEPVLNYKITHFSSETYRCVQYTDVYSLLILSEVMA